MYHVEFDNLDDGWHTLLRELLKSGRSVAPRGFGTAELAPAAFTLTDPHRCHVLNPERKVNYAYSAAEFCWVAAGRDDLETLQFFNSKVADFADVPGPDGNMTFFGAYGPPIVEQLPYVLENLREPDSRQAVLTIWRPSPPKTRDVPCTVSLQFTLREGKLSLLVNMRSNDVVLGTAYDVPMFCRVLSLVASRLNVGVGKYHHVAGSLHLYERDFGTAWRCLNAHKRGLYSQNVPHGLERFSVEDPTSVWRTVRRVVAARDGETVSWRHGEGWDQLVQEMWEYALRKRAKEAKS